MIVTDTIDVPCSNMAMHGDSLYVYSYEWDNQTNDGPPLTELSTSAQNNL